MKTKKYGLKNGKGSTLKELQIWLEEQLTPPIPAAFFQYPELEYVLTAFLQLVEENINKIKK